MILNDFDFFVCAIYLLLLRFIFSLFSEESPEDRRGYGGIKKVFPPDYL